VLVSDFHFELPEELIAQHPPAERGSSRMLVLGREQGAGDREQEAADGLVDAWFRDFPGFLRAGDLLVLNDSRVLPARLFGTRGGLTTQAGSPLPSGVVEVLLTEEVEEVRPEADPPSQKRDGGHRVDWHPEKKTDAGILRSAQNDNSVGRRPVGHPLLWRALVRPARKVVVGERLEFREADGAGEAVLAAEVVAAGEFGERTLRFAPVEDFYERVARIGHMPLPPYIGREWARRAGAKAPNSGLSPSRGLKPAATPGKAAGSGETAGPVGGRGVRDVESEDRERYQTVFSQKAGSQEARSAAAPTAGLHFTPEILAALEARGVEVRYVTLHVGLGTFQPVRVSELKDIRLHSERYTLPAATADALNRARMEGRRVVAVGTTTTRTLEHIGALVGDGGFQAHSGSTSIFIGPGHRFRVVGGLLTNFHLPESTLLMLVSAFAGDGDQGRQRVLAAYAHAVRAGYRFYSYGDCMLVLPDGRPARAAVTS
jgi:S-adenosylmethionine:tRNA ribosyltransferase-isomerase